MLNVFAIVLRIGVPASMHPNVLKISLDELTNELHRKTVVARVSPESERLRSLTEELNTMQKMKTILVASNDAANKVRFDVLHLLNFEVHLLIFFIS